MWSFDGCCSRCETDHVTKKISCSDCGLVLGSSDDFFTSDLGTFHNPGSVATTNTSPTDDAVVTTQQSNASSDDSTIIASMSDRLNLLATVQNQANEISEQIKRQGIAMEPNVRFAASIYIACRQNGMALSYKDISSVADGAKRWTVYSAVKSAVDKLGLSPQLMMHIRATEFAKRYSTDLQMHSQAVKAAEEAAERCTNHVNSGRAPSSVAAAVVYIIAQLSYNKKRLKDIKDATGLHKDTIRNTYKDLYPYLSRIIPTWFADANDLKKLHSPGAIY